MNNCHRSVFKSRPALGLHVYLFIYTCINQWSVNGKQLLPATNATIHCKLS